MRSSFSFALALLISLGRVLGATPPVDNDECALAIMLAVNDSCVLTTADWNDATQSLPADTCGGFASPSANDLWYSFIATSGSTIVRVMSADSNDAVVEAYGGDCASLEVLACSDETLSGGVETIALATTIGATYHVRTYWWDYGAFPADADLSICVFNGPPSPANDDCGSVTAQNLSIGTSLLFSGTTTGADTAGDYAPGSTIIGEDPSVWHAFTTTECANVTIEYCGTDPAFEIVWNVLATACPADSVITGTSPDWDACGDGNITLHFDSLAAGTYYLPVLFDLDFANGPYTVEVSATQCVVGIGDIVQDEEWTVLADDGGILLWHDGALGDARFELFSLDGKLVCAGALEPSVDGHYRIVLPGSAAPGIRILRVTAGDGVHAWRVLVP